MATCWHANPDERPTFATVLERIGYCMQDPDVLGMPLPIFQRPLSVERDTTLVRASAHTTLISLISSFLFIVGTEPTSNSFKGMETS